MSSENKIQEYLDSLEEEKIELLFNNDTQKTIKGISKKHNFFQKKVYTEENMC